MNDFLYPSGGKLYAKTYLEIYVPDEYFKDKFAVNKGAYVETFGLVYIRASKNGQDGPIKLLNIPTIIDLNLYAFEYGEIKVKGKTISVMILKYLKDSYVLHQTIQQGREVAGFFLNTMLYGKLPKTLDYANIIDIWWKNLEIAGVNFKIPSKIFEMIIASIYRNPNNPKERFGQYYGKQTNPNGHNYNTGNVRDVVEGLSTFSGMVFEDMPRMITSGINNAIEGIEEPISPLEKIIYY